MRQNEIRPPNGAKKARKRVGRGDGSGHGSFSGRGLKGQNSRSGGGVRPNFEGGQLPITKALPMMRGFTNIFRKEFSVVNVDKLTEFQANTKVTLELMVERGIVKDLKQPVKILGRGEIDAPLVVEAHSFSRTARQKIEGVGGSVKEIG